jgi:hypothetical protein
MRRAWRVIFKNYSLEFKMLNAEGASLFIQNYFSQHEIFFKKLRHNGYYYDSVYRIDYFQNAFRHSSVFGLYAQDNSSIKPLYLIYVKILERNFFLE